MRLFYVLKHFVSNAICVTFVGSIRHNLKTYKMKKSDLKTLHVLEFENGMARIVMLGTPDGDVTVDNRMQACNNNRVRLYDLYCLSNLDDDLKDVSKFNQLSDVVKVYDQYGELLWERKEMFSKSDLKHAMTCKLSNGTLNRIIEYKGELILHDYENATSKINDYNDQLIARFSKFNIDEIYDVVDNNLIMNLNKKGELLWKR